MVVEPDSSEEDSEEDSEEELDTLPAQKKIPPPRQHPPWAVEQFQHGRVFPFAMAGI